MTLIGCWRFTVKTTQNGVDNGQTICLEPDSLFFESTKTSESRINEYTSYLMQITQSADQSQSLTRGRMRPEKRSLWNPASSKRNGSFSVYITNTFLQQRAASALRFLVVIRPVNIIILDPVQ